LFTHPDMLDHRPGEDHPERPERLTAVLDALDDASGLDLERREAPRARPESLLAVHPQAHVDRVFAAAAQAASGRARIDDDTAM
ncbi:hypothetical protein, partial [Klebsiella pneumoniae]